MQTDFFEQQEQGPDSPASATDRPATRRVFLYDNQVFEDPGTEYSVRDVLNFLSQTYPELGNGTWHSRTIPDGAAGAVEEITFVKVTGEKGSQVTIYDLPPDSPRLLPGPTNNHSPYRRIFLYDNQVFADPGSEYSVQDVLDFLAMTYPELAAGTWHTRTLPDGAAGAVEEITFVKVTGEKGSSITGRQLAVRQLVACLNQLSPTQLQAITLLDRIRTMETDDQQAFSVSNLLELTPDIESALHQAERIATTSQRIGQQCLQLTPIPHPKIPLGF
jgi:PRTRC genetic system protein C